MKADCLGSPEFQFLNPQPSETVASLMTVFFLASVFCLEVSKMHQGNKEPMNLELIFV